MNMLPAETWTSDFKRVVEAIRYIDAHRLDQPGLDQVAAAVNLSPFHFQRLFTRWAGVSPKRYLGFLTLAHARRMLDGSASILDAALDAGLSGPSRLHDLFVSFEAVTPGEAKRQGADLIIRYGVHPSPFGPCLLGLTDRGVCRLTFLDADADACDEAAQADLARHWPAAALIPAEAETAPYVRRLFLGRNGDDTPLRLHIRGTNFQIKVWEALLNLPQGKLITYSDLARAVGHPRAARAVGNAMNANPVAFCIPCHSVIPVLRGTLDFGDYATGPDRRRAIIAWDAARAEGVAPPAAP